MAKELQNTQNTRPEEYVLVAVSTGKEQEAQTSLSELSELLQTAGGHACCTMVQNLPSPIPATYIGSGKVEELKALVSHFEADGIICDDELTPAQLANLSDQLGVKVLDRTILILDIFAAHAKTAEGKLQVEMAQQKYRLSRLTGLGKSLSRLGGGIGTRGPGETKLETDRRVIASRLTRLSAQIEELAKNRENTRKKRKEQGLPQVALVGYTNAGKSTWLNCLTKTEAKVLTADMLFATLDPATRRAVLPNGREVLVTDTVGFIHKLPHQLIDAFKSTLEEAAYADILIHVVDCSDPFFPDKMEVVYKTLAELSLSDKPVITVFNKADRIPELQSSLLPFKMHDEKAMAVVTGSAKKGEGTAEIFAAIESYYREHQIYYEGLISYDDTRIIEQIRRQGELLSEDYQPEGIYITAYLPPYFHLT